MDHYSTTLLTNDIRSLIAAEEGAKGAANAYKAGKDVSVTENAGRQAVKTVAENAGRQAVKTVDNWSKGIGNPSHISEPIIQNIRHMAAKSAKETYLEIHSYNFTGADGSNTLKFKYNAGQPAANAYRDVVLLNEMSNKSPVLKKLVAEEAGKRARLSVDRTNQAEPSGNHEWQHFTNREKLAAVAAREAAKAYLSAYELAPAGTTSKEKENMGLKASELAYNTIHIQMVCDKELIVTQQNIWDTAWSDSVKIDNTAFDQFMNDNNKVKNKSVRANFENTLNNAFIAVAILSAKYAGEASRLAYIDSTGNSSKVALAGLYAARATKAAKLATHTDNEAEAAAMAAGKAAVDYYSHAEISNIAKEAGIAAAIAFKNNAAAAVAGLVGSEAAKAYKTRYAIDSLVVGYQRLLNTLSLPEKTPAASAAKLAGISIERRYKTDLPGFTIAWQTTPGIKDDLTTESQYKQVSQEVGVSAAKAYQSANQTYSNSHDISYEAAKAAGRSRHEPRLYSSKAIDNRHNENESQAAGRAAAIAKANVNTALIIENAGISAADAYYRASVDFSDITLSGVFKTLCYEVAAIAAGAAVEDTSHNPLQHVDDLKKDSSAVQSAGKAAAHAVKFAKNKTSPVSDDDSRALAVLSGKSAADAYKEVHVKYSSYLNVDNLADVAAKFAGKTRYAYNVMDNILDKWPHQNNTTLPEHKHTLSDAFTKHVTQIPREENDICLAAGIAGASSMNKGKNATEQDNAAKSAAYAYRYSIDKHSLEKYGAECAAEAAGNLRDFVSHVNAGEAAWQAGIAAIETYILNTTSNNIYHTADNTADRKQRSAQAARAAGEAYIMAINECERETKANGGEKDRGTDLKKNAAIAAAETAYYVLNHGSSNSQRTSFISQNSENYSPKSATTQAAEAARVSYFFNYDLLLTQLSNKITREAEIKESYLQAGLSAAYSFDVVRYNRTDSTWNKNQIPAVSTSPGTIPPAYSEIRAIYAARVAGVYVDRTRDRGALNYSLIDTVITLTENNVQAFTDAQLKQIMKDNTITNQIQLENLPRPNIFDIGTTDTILRPDEYPSLDQTLDAGHIAAEAYLRVLDFYFVNKSSQTKAANPWKDYDDAVKENLTELSQDAKNMLKIASVEARLIVDKDWSDIETLNLKTTVHDQTRKKDDATRKRALLAAEVAAEVYKLEKTADSTLTTNALFAAAKAAALTVYESVTAVYTGENIIGLKRDGARSAGKIAAKVYTEAMKPAPFGVSNDKNSFTGHPYVGKFDTNNTTGIISIPPTDRDKILRAEMAAEFAGRAVNRYTIHSSTPNPKKPVIASSQTVSSTSENYTRAREAAEAGALCGWIVYNKQQVKDKTSALKSCLQAARAYSMNEAVLLENGGTMTDANKKLCKLAAATAGLMHHYNVSKDTFTIDSKQRFSVESDDSTNACTIAAEAAILSYSRDNKTSQVYMKVKGSGSVEDARNAAAIDAAWHAAKEYDRLKDTNVDPSHRTMSVSLNQEFTIDAARIGALEAAGILDYNGEPNKSYYHLGVVGKHLSSYCRPNPYPSPGSTIISDPDYILLATDYKAFEHAGKAAAESNTFYDETNSNTGCYYAANEAAKYYTEWIESKPTNADLEHGPGYYPWPYGYPLDIANDTSGSNTTPSTPVVQYSHATHYNGSSAYTSFPTLKWDEIAANNNFTFMTWVNADHTSNWSRIFDSGKGTSNFFFVTVSQDGHRGTGAQGRPFIAFKNGGAEYYIECNRSVTDYSWYHLAFVYTNGTPDIYINGQQATLRYSNWNTGQRLKDLGTTTQNYIGKAMFWQDPYLSGSVDETSLWNKAFTGTELLAIYNDKKQFTGAEADLKHYWKHNEGTGTTLADSASGNQNKQDGTLNGNVTWNDNNTFMNPSTPSTPATQL